MPLYDYECKHCKEIIEDIIAHIDDDVPCPDCKRPMERLISGTFGINMGVGAYGYFDETLDKYIHTNRQKREEMRKQGVTPKGDTPKPDGEVWV